jgi:hypothetical protein
MLELRAFVAEAARELLHQRTTSSRLLGRLPRLIDEAGLQEQHERSRRRL